MLYCIAWDNTRTRYLRMLDDLRDCLEDDFPDIATIGTPRDLNELHLCSSQIEILAVSQSVHALRIISLRLVTRRCGYGRMVVETIIDICREADLTPLAVNVVSDEEGFWKHLGFVPLDDGSRDWVHGGWLHSYQETFS